MLQSKLFPKTQKQAPRDEISANAQLLIRAGFIDKLMAGVYTFLPLGFRVLKKIENIIREEMVGAGGQEILMPALQPKENWDKTGRWETMNDLYRIKDARDKEFALGPTHEEIIFPFLKKTISSYKDLPVYVFQIQNKFRMELRAKSGLLRGREFLMKDFYSFHANENDRDRYYDLMIDIYKRVFARAGVGKETYFTFAPGGTFSKYSDEFQTVTEAGEDVVHICDKCRKAINNEIFREQRKCPQCGKSDFRKEKAIEVGNIFKLKNKFAEDFDLKFKDKDGHEKFVITACYGIGLGRLMGAVVEVNHDDKGIIWPEAVAPFRIHLLLLNNELRIKNKADELYKDLQKAKIEVLYDDRDDVSAGEKFAEADLIGIPYRVVVSEKTAAQNKLEIKKRNEAKARLITKKELLKYV
ncbi:MAG: prolyl-tRNA synthetase [Candidatus Terrybacteria bacterium]|nr:prolyl-tRNA synthetase [Candidatus Terrybacteria bacterium]